MPSQKMIGIGRRLRTARDLSGLTQQKVAAYLDVPVPMVSYWETGQRDIDLDNLSRLADLYGHSLAALVEGETAHPVVAVAFRAENVCEEDLRIVTWARKIASNLDLLDRLLKEPGSNAQ